ncbi:hypothetical protein BR63_12740 [Thermanaerosceptrum fracticalcis]|uniref:Uncharacterized protein n=1 Tax=Thermanaerosceptrum fracticalcis TaxID=1712410 RepID=A0A7G6E4U3_THEFR|nr:hypothetical protein [Thermanaerosceptrum fracticalcis]QNB47097.1 hypothetical protein BR63_12740 [Thermanaerosceptrum fracticalcis]
MKEVTYDGSEGSNFINEWPSRPWAIHSGNGSEFLSDHLLHFTKQDPLEFTRSRPYKKR